MCINYRSSKTELLNDEQYPENVFQTAYITAQNDLPNNHPIQHRYSTIDDSRIISNSTTKETSFNLPPVKPPAIIKSRSITFSTQLTQLPPHLPNITQVPSPKNVLQSDNSSFSYKRMSSTEKDTDQEYDECTDNRNNESYSLLNIDSSITTNELEKLTNVNEENSQLENWDYEWNPMYMKLPFNIKYTNTL